MLVTLITCLKIIGFGKNPNSAPGPAARMNYVIGIFVFKFGYPVVNALFTHLAVRMFGAWNKERLSIYFKANPITTFCYIPSKWCMGAVGIDAIGQIAGQLDFDSWLPGS